jgi:hypothetical protein
MSRRNDELRERYGDDNGGGGGSLEEKKDGGNGGAAAAEDDKIISMSETVLRKARNHDFYLGLESTWLYKK